MIDVLQNKRSLVRADIIPTAEYAAIRRARRPELVAMKKNRRVECGPVATFYFENFATMWWQIQEMLYIEKGGEEQIADELRAYAPMVPNGAELIATVMFEIEEPQKRHELLLRIGGVENCFALKIGDDLVKAVPEGDLERTREEDGKASSVHFLHFPLTKAQVTTFRDPATPAYALIDHPEYGHTARLTQAVKAELARDLD
jgi:hypothetical protein